MAKRILRPLRSFLWFLILSSPPAFSDTQSITVRGEIRILDGDTLEIGPLLIRLHGIDAPERSQSCLTVERDKWPCGSKATKRLRALIEGQKISCNALDRDPYGRIIARCEVNDIDLGTTLIEEGLAWAFVEYSTDYVKAERNARERKLGVWQMESQTPWAYRDDKWNRALAASPDGKCPIKGNIGSDKFKRKIYHTPWSPNYSNTKINVDAGERWFCSEGEALSEGWKAVAER